MRGHAAVEKYDIAFRERDFRGNFRRIIYVVVRHVCTGIICYSTARFILDVRFAFKYLQTPQRQ